ncbi:MAG: tetratricopeptide repeat protein [Nevskiales bacterium]|nr:tetratricopeptide repeat protein [Nevskiales bacterium]
MKRVLFGLLGVAAAHAQAAELYVPGTVDDPHVRTAVYLSEDNRNMSAAVELRLADPGDDALRMPEAYQWQLADSYLLFGLKDQAEAIYQNLAATSDDKVRIAKSRLQVAKFDYQRGYTAQARAVLLRQRESLPEELLPQWQDLLSRVQLAEQRYGEAAETLTELDNADAQSSYARYNLAVALIKDGRAPQGQTVLDRIGRLVPHDAEELALRDRANTSLGWHFLQQQQGGTAGPIFERVRVDGPFSNRALLGLGWAHMAPQGKRVTKAQVGDEPTQADPFTTFSTLGALVRPGFLEDDIFKRAGLRAFSLQKASKEEQENLKRALVPWVELISRDPMNTAVQEAWLAIPYTLDRLGAHTQALQYYEKAIEVLENARARMTTALDSIKQGRMVETIVRREIDSEAGWTWHMRDLPDAPETYFLQSLLAEHRFQEALKNYRDVRMLARNLDSWNDRLRTVQRAATDHDRPGLQIDEVVERAANDWEAPWKGLQIRLRPESTLSPPGRYSDTAPAEPQVSMLLQLAQTPRRFNGPLERSQALYERIANLREQVAQAGAAQSQLLRDMATEELEGQKRQIERYLIEARFSLARLYDRQRKGDSNEP